MLGCFGSTDATLSQAPNPSANSVADGKPHEPGGVLQSAVAVMNTPAPAGCLLAMDGRFGSEGSMSKIPMIDGMVLKALSSVTGIAGAIMLAQIRELCEGLDDRQIAIVMRAAMAAYQLPKDADREASALMIAIDELRKAWLELKDLRDGAMRV